MKLTAKKIYEEFNKGKSYKSSIDLFETVRINENMYNGKQWEGCNAPDLDKPVINVLRRVVSYFISMIVSNDVSASCRPFEETEENAIISKVVSDATDKAIELSDFKNLSREVLRNAAVDGDGYLHFFFDPDIETGQLVKGDIRAEIIENTNILFGNPHSAVIDNQPYILVTLKMPTTMLKEEAEANGLDENIIEAIVPDNEDEETKSEAYSSELTTVIYRYFRKNGSIWCVKSTPKVILKEEWDTTLKLYPISAMSWDKVKGSCHGVAALTPYIPNQIAINQLFGMALLSIKNNAFPKIMYDRTKIMQWSNKVGEAIAVNGNPAENAIAVPWRSADMSNQVIHLIENLIQKTLEFMGASDTALGNIRPDNTSAIIATQKASSMPLELQKMAFYEFTERSVRIMQDLMRANYGTRLVTQDVNGQRAVGDFDFSAIGNMNMSLRVDIGAASYYSELTQIQTLDNLLAKGIITDASLYLEQIPDAYVPGKAKILSALQDKKTALAQQAQPAGLQMPGVM